MRCRIPSRRRRSGQALVESCVVIALICLIFFGLFQLSQLYAARAVLTQAASAGARARMVGFNDFMVYKVIRTAAIPNAGRMTHPQSPTSAGGLDWGAARPGEALDYALYAGTPGSPSLELERSRIPNYLYATRWGELTGILGYERWDGIRYFENSSDEYVLLGVRQDYPLMFPMHRTFYAADEVPLRGDGVGVSEYAAREKHYPLFLEE
ncbi:MAG: pilus assembly protein [Kiritimatiellae bacterium]|nr:pilus assembly protein [Kiritimatiellia bacterium]